VRLLRLLAALALAAALLLLALHPLRVTHGTWGIATCLCPACIVTGPYSELSWSEYC
jgi:hypothetical protein